MRKKATAGAITLATVTLLMSLLSWADPLEKWQLKLTNRFYDRNTPSDQIVIVGIDESSLDEETGLGRFSQWDRRVYGKVIENLEKNGAAVIALDILFSENSNGLTTANVKQILKQADTKDGAQDAVEQGLEKYLENPHPHDQALADVLSKYSNIILVRSGSSQKGDLTRISPINPIPILHDSSKAGWGNFFPDRDDVVRRIPSKLYDVETNEWDEHLAVKVARQFLGEKFAKSLEESGGLDSEGNLIVNFVADRGAYKQIPFIQVYRGLIRPEDTQGKIVLIGATTERLKDVFVSPRSTKFPTPGVELHANAIQTLLEGNFLHEQSLAGQIATLALLVILVTGITLFLPILPALGFTATLLAAYHLLAEPIFDHGLPGQSRGLILNLVYPTLALLLAYLSATLYRSLTESREKAQLKMAFGKYMSKDLVGKILENPAALKLGGEKRTVTVFFSDIKDSTHYSEILSPEAWVAQLNEYFEVMAGIVMKNNGNLNKFEGDAIMAFWGAPLDEADHARLAARTALECRAALKGLHERWTAAQKPLIDFRVGLSTGEVIAGNMGSRERFDYTVMGDRVNLGSRLEAANKEYGTHVMVSGETAGALGGSASLGTGPKASSEFALRALDKLRVKGKDKPVEVFELMGMASQLTDAGKTMLDTYHHALEIYRSSRSFDDFAKAEASFQEVLKLAPNDGPTLVYLKRCANFKATPPPAGWDGTWTLEHK